MSTVRSLKDTPKDALAKDAFVQGKGPADKAATVVKLDQKMVNTRLPAELVKRMKIACAHQEITIKEFMVEAVERRVKELGF